MTKNQKINVIKKMTIPLLLTQSLLSPSAFAGKSTEEQAQFHSCMSAKNIWIFENFNPIDRTQLELRQSMVQEFEQQLTSIDLLRMDTSAKSSLQAKGAKLGLPESVIESILCIEKFRRLYPEDDNRGFRCTQSCGVTAR